MPSWLRWKKAKLKVMPSGSKVNPLVAVCNTTTPLNLSSPVFHRTLAALPPLPKLPNPSSLLFSFFNQVERVPLLPLCAFSPAAQHSQPSTEHKV